MDIEWSDLAVHLFLYSDIFQIFIMIFEYLNDINIHKQSMIYIHTNTNIIDAI